MAEDFRPYSERPAARPDPALVEAAAEAAKVARAPKRQMTPERWFYVGLASFAVLLFGGMGILILIHSIG
jgi:hypothetical protein